MNQTAQFFVLHGTTIDGQRFRPSDWAERLAGVLAPYRPLGSRTSHLTYSPYAVPKIINDVRCVVIDNRLRGLEPLAWKFVHDFAIDNKLQTSNF
jgi:hypothetical protein